MDVCECRKKHLSLCFLSSLCPLLLACVCGVGHGRNKSSLYFLLFIFGTHKDRPLTFLLLYTQTHKPFSAFVCLFFSLFPWCCCCCYFSGNPFLKSTLHIPTIISRFFLTGLITIRIIYIYTHFFFCLSCLVFFSSSLYLYCSKSYLLSGAVPEISSSSSESSSPS